MASTRSRGRTAFPKSNMGFIVLVVLLTAGFNTIGKPDVDEGEGEGPPPPIGNCDDGIDNDLDGRTDTVDPECDLVHPDYDGNEDGDA